MTEFRANAFEKDFAMDAPTDIQLKIQLGVENLCADCSRQKSVWTPETVWITTSPQDWLEVSVALLKTNLAKHRGDELLSLKTHSS